jgi:hypothetical protein
MTHGTPTARFAASALDPQAGRWAVLEPVVAATYGRLVPAPVGRNGANGSAARTGWVGVDELADDPSSLDLLLEGSGSRFRSDDRALLSAQLVRESVATLVTTAVRLWAHDRRLPQLGAGDVALREGEHATQVGLRHLRLAVLAGDPLAGLPGVEVLDEEGMFERLLHQAIGHPVPAGALPGGPLDRRSAVATIIAAVRRAVRCGDRHLWGTAALTAGSALAAVSHTIGPRADDDRRRLFAARPDLARTVELVTVDDRVGGELTFALRRTCCLLFKLPDRTQCGTCSLHDHDACLAWTADYHRRERRERRPRLPEVDGL